MNKFMKILSTIALFGFIISAPIFGIHGGVHRTSQDSDSACPNPCPVSTTIDSAVTRDISIVGAQGVLVQSCGTGDGCCCKSWNKKNGGEMPLTDVSKNTDGTYTLLSQNGYTRYYLADDSGKAIDGTVQLSNNFANATTWTFIDGSPNNRITNIDGSIFTPPTQPASTPSRGSNHGTYGPQTFTPSRQFAGSGLVGNYFNSSKVATIHDPTQANPTSYTFDQIQSISTAGRAWPKGLTHIGSFPTPNFVNSKTTCSQCPIKTTQLFGNLVSQNSAQ